MYPEAPTTTTFSPVQLSPGTNSIDTQELRLLVGVITAGANSPDRPRTRPPAWPAAPAQHIARSQIVGFIIAAREGDKTEIWTLGPPYLDRVLLLAVSGVAASLALARSQPW